MKVRVQCFREQGQQESSKRELCQGRHDWGGLATGFLTCKVLKAGGAEITWDGSPGGSRAVGLH